MYTCNIDGLDHQLDLHDKKIVAVHGTAARACCEFCKRDMPSEVFLAFMRSKIKDITASDASAPAQSSEIACPKCRKAGIRPAVVLYGTCLDDKAAQRMELLKTTRLLLVVGTSLTVKPISQLPSLCSQAARVVVNRDPPPHDFAFDSGRDHLLQGDCDDMFAALAARLGWLPELDTRFRDTLPPASLQALNKALEFEAAKLK